MVDGKLSVESERFNWKIELILLGALLSCCDMTKSNYSLA